MKLYTSNAKWPDCVSVGPSVENVSTDTHKTREQALAVCNILKKEGFGCEGKIFPLIVWVEEIEVEDKKPNNILDFDIIHRNSEEDYANISTERLLDVFRKLTRCIGVGYYNLEIGYGNESDFILLERAQEVLKRVLAKREHVQRKKDRRKKVLPKKKR